MKASLVVIVVLVIAILGFLLIYSQQHEITKQAQQVAPSAAGYGSTHAAGSGSAPAAGGYGGQQAPPAASGYGK